MEKVGRISEAMAASLILAIAALITYEVVARYFFNSPTGFANQFAAYSMPLVAFFACGATLGRKAHVAVDVVIDLLSHRARAKIALVTEILSSVLLIYVTWMAVLEVLDSYDNGIRSFSTVITFPEYIPQLVMPMGLVILVCYQVFSVADAVKEIYRVRNRRQK